MVATTWRRAKHNGGAVDRLVTALADVVGPSHVLTDPDVTASYERDWTGRFAGPAAAVVRPASTGEVAAVMALLHDAGRPVVPQGGNTGLVGGSGPLPRGGGRPRATPGAAGGGWGAGGGGPGAAPPRLRRRLAPRLEHRTTGLLAFADADAAVEALVRLRRRLPGTLEAVELFLAGGVALVCDHLGLAPPFGRLDPGYLLVEAAGAHDPPHELAEAGLGGGG